MENNISVFSTYEALLEELKELNAETQNKVISDEPDAFITQNINFFTKSFMITLCAYLESFLKDITMTIIDNTNQKLANSKITHNLVKWSILKKKELGELNDNDLLFEDLTIKITKKELDEFISGSPYKTEKLFKKIGIKLYEDIVYKEQKEKVISIVEKRNKIVHHNDSASDISFSDIQTNIDTINSYMKNINSIIKAELVK
ncbi:HEPN domain-containing protein [Flavobacterium sp. I-SCBP12n]|uniref:HEPN domain-containing protein n=1 Tax=Flavobacterium pygoscelis TaxID=2893176 RepID=A0A9X1XTU8_9FLAO|nr:HEPN domain-containing protein [Flavobacterium pygoscelis]MCK8143117.1 HEPN domain-containing protein [Flavobacterium pygoscelis]